MLIKNKILFILIFYALSGSFMPQLVEDFLGISEGNVFFISGLATYFIGMMILAVNIKYFKNHGKSLSYPLIFLCAVLASFIGSEYVGVTIIKTMGYIGLVMLGASFVSSARDKSDLLDVMYWFATSYIFFNFLVYVFDIQYSYHYLDEHHGSFRGISAHKNALGLYLSISLLSILIYKKNKLHKIISIPQYLICAGLIAESNSVTPIVVLAMSLFLIFLYGVLSKRIIIALFFVLSSVYVSLSLLDYSIESVLLDFFMLYGRDFTFSGRTLIWIDLIQEISNKIYLGHGYHTYWSSPLADALKIRQDHEVFDSHNSYLELLLGGGIIMLLAGIFWIYYFLKQLSSELNKKSDDYSLRWMLVLCIHILIFSCVTSLWGRPNDFSFLLFILSFLFFNKFYGKNHKHR